MLEGKTFGSAGEAVVIEEFMEGEEASVLCFTDGTTIVPMISAQDHKRIGDGDMGANTGGMGAYAPAPVMTKELDKIVYDTILLPAVKAMKKEGCPFRGCLYAGLMITKEGPKVVEFNCRFGDPETEAILPLLESDLARIMLACAKGTLKKEKVEWKMPVPWTSSWHRKGILPPIHQEKKFQVWKKQKGRLPCVPCRQCEEKRQVLC